MACELQDLGRGAPHVQRAIRSQGGRSFEGGRWRWHATTAKGDTKSTHRDLGGTTRDLGDALEERRYAELAAVNLSNSLRVPRLDGTRRCCRYSVTKPPEQHGTPSNLPTGDWERSRGYEGGPSGRTGSRRRREAGLSPACRRRREADG